MTRYPRGKSWNWYKRHKGEFLAEKWLKLRIAKQELIRGLSQTFYGSGDGLMAGLSAIVDDSTDVMSIDEDNIRRTTYGELHNARP